MTTQQPPLGDWLRDPEVEVVKARPERRTAILRRVDLWSALKLSLALYSCVFVVMLTAGTLLWIGLRHAGAIGNIEKLIEDLGGYVEGSYHFKDGFILRMTAVIGPIVVVLGSLATVAAVAVFNAVSRLFGGVEVTVSDED
jgi:Na+/H+ antiporter NhaD/arsenite permease-like protein